METAYASSKEEVWYSIVIQMGYVGLGPIRSLLIPWSMVVEWELSALVLSLTSRLGVVCVHRYIYIYVYLSLLCRF